MIQKKSKSLTCEQKAVVTFNKWHSIVEAVAGSGKTTTLIKRVEYLIKNQNINPDDILILMYNKDAQVTFENKLAKIKGLGNKPQVKTFHSFAKAVLDKNDIQYCRGRHELLDMLSTKKLLKQAYIENSPHKAPDVNDIEELELFISICKANNIAPESCEHSELLECMDRNSEINRLAFASFNQLCTDLKKRTFDDLLLDAMRDLIELPSGIKKLQHIIVDEYQDVNYVQHTMIRLLTTENTKVMIVGDQAQCIYAFRGSNVNFIDHIFARDFKHVSKFRLSKSFRFGHAVSMLANRVMLRNPMSSDALCISDFDNFKTEVRLSNYEKLLPELMSCVKQVGTKAILARNRSDLTESLIYLKLLSEPYNVGKSSSFIRQDELTFIAMVMFLSLNETDILAIPSKFAQDSLQGFINCASLKVTTSEIYRLRSLLKKSTASFKSSLIQLLNTHKHALEPPIVTFIDQQPISLSQSLAGLFSKMLQLNIIDLAINSSGNRRQANNITRIMDNLINVTNSDNLTCQDFFKIFEHHNTADGVLLSTIHGTKGLEWDHVMLVGLNDDTFPHSKDSDEVQEERRLYYVGITRCIKSLTLLAPIDNVLNKWIENGWYTSPKHKKPIATRFLYESDINNAIAFSKVCVKGAFIPKEYYSNKQYREYHQQLSNSD